MGRLVYARSYILDEMAFDSGNHLVGGGNRAQLLGKSGRNRYPMKERSGPRRRKGNGAKVWKEPLVSIYVGVTLALILASGVRIWLDR